MKPKYSSLLWGLLFILIGAGYAGNAFGFWHFSIFFRGWWTLFIIVPCLANLIESGPSTGSVVGLIVGVLLLLGRQNILDGAFIGRLIIPIALVIIGLGIILSNSLHWALKARTGNVIIMPLAIRATLITLPLSLDRPLTVTTRPLTEQM